MYPPQYIIMVPSQDRRFTDENAICPTFLFEEEKATLVEPLMKKVINGLTNGYNLYIYIYIYIYIYTSDENPVGSLT